MDDNYKGLDKELLGLLRKPVSKWNRKELHYFVELLIRLNSPFKVGIFTRVWVNDLIQKKSNPALSGKNLFPEEKKKAGAPLKNFNVSAEKWEEIIEIIRAEIADEYRKKGTPRKSISDRKVAESFAKGYLAKNLRTGKHLNAMTDEFAQIIRQVKRRLKKKKNNGE